MPTKNPTSPPLQDLNASTSFISRAFKRPMHPPSETPVCVSVAGSRMARSRCMKAGIGAVLVSPCISPGEKEIARAGLDAGWPLIVLLENGFAPMYKPPGRYFDACANGRLLMLAPFPHHREKRTITREQCLTLNEWAKAILETSNEER